MDFSPQAPLSMGFSGKEYWSGLSFAPPWDLLDPRIEPQSPALVSHTGCIETILLSHMGSPASTLQVSLRDRVGSEVGGGFRMRNTCTPMADSCQCMAKTTTIL